MKRVKIACDENIPQRLVRMLQTGFGDQGFEFIWVPEFVPPRTQDESWADSFRRFGGRVVISGDKNIAKRPHQVLAFKENRFVCFFCDKNWASKDGMFKVAHLIYWWPRIQNKINESQPMDCWWVPALIQRAEFRKVEVPDGVLKAARRKKSV